MSGYKDVFLMKSVLGKNVDYQSPESVRWWCVDKAYGDMMSGGRYLKVNEKYTRQAKIYKMLDDKGWRFDRALIKDVSSCFDDCVTDHGRGIIEADGKIGTAFGLSQKVVNMTFKYLYSFNEYITDRIIDFTDCDCPVDSFVIDSLKKDKPMLIQLSEKEKVMVRKAVWSRLTEEEYDAVQRACGMAGSENDDFQEALQTTNDCSRRLLYDFFAW